MTPDDFIGALRRGDGVALEQLFEQFEQPLYRFFVCSHRDHHLAQEQTSEAFLQLVRSLPRFRGDSAQLRPFVFAIARHIQKRPRRRHVSLPSGFDHPAGGTPPDSCVESQERLNVVLDAIHQFDETVRTVLLLRFVEGLSLAEVSSVLNLPVGTVKSHIHRGRHELNRLLPRKPCES